MEKTVRIVAVAVNLVGDKDIIDWIDALPHREISSSIRDVIREHISRNEAQEKMIRETWEIVKRLEQRGPSFVVMGDGGVPEVGLDEETAVNLKGLGV